MTLSKSKVVTTKQCSRCGQVKNASEFSIDRSKKDGLNAWCKSCKRNYDISKSSTNSKKSTNFTNSTNSKVEFKSGSVTKESVLSSDISTKTKYYIDKYLSTTSDNQVNNQCNNQVNKQHSIDELILETKVKLTILEHYKQTNQGNQIGVNFNV